MEGCHLRVIRFNPRIRKPRRTVKLTVAAVAYAEKIARLDVEHPGAAALVKRLIDSSIEHIATRT